MRIRTRLTLWYTSALFAILVVISALSYSALAWSLRQDMDASLLTIARVMRDSDSAAASADLTSEVLRELLGPDFYDKFVQFFDPEGRLGFRSRPSMRSALPLSPEARGNALRGLPTVETVEVRGPKQVRVVTPPVRRPGSSRVTSSRSTTATRSRARRICLGWVMPGRIR